jgi:plasmid stability protein
MTHSVTVNVPEDVYTSLLQRAAAAGRSVEELVAEWVAQQAQPPQPEVTLQEVEARRQWLAKYGNLNSSTNPNTSDNKRIDADLAAGYSR